ncbi:hypothetical protein GCM10009084_03490 [Marinomonas primoryensis]
MKARYYFSFDPKFKCLTNVFTYEIKNNPSRAMTDLRIISILCSGSSPPMKYDSHIMEPLKINMAE